MKESSYVNLEMGHSPNSITLLLTDMTSANHINFKWSLENNAKFLIVLFYCFMISKKKNHAALLTNQNENYL